MGLIQEICKYNSIRFCLYKLVLLGQHELWKWSHWSGTGGMVVGQAMDVKTKALVALTKFEICLLFLTIITKNIYLLVQNRI